VAEDSGTTTRELPPCWCTVLGALNFQARTHAGRCARHRHHRAAVLKTELEEAVADAADDEPTSRSMLQFRRDQAMRAALLPDQGYGPYGVLNRSTSG